jgi:hypothetical protein
MAGKRKATEAEVQTAPPKKPRATPARAKKGEKNTVKDANGKSDTVTHVLFSGAFGVGSLGHSVSLPDP